MMLFHEAKEVQVSLKLLSVHVQAKLVKLWNEYDQGEKSPEQLLRACAHMYAPEESRLTA